MQDYFIVHFNKTRITKQLIIRIFLIPSYVQANRKNPLESKILTDAVLERVEICFGAILAFCVSYLEIEPNASLQCLDGNVEGGQVDGAQYCTVLYNDESHTFDQVIQTLTKIAKCRAKDAMEIVAAIDREGRAVVKCDTFEVG